MTTAEYYVNLFVGRYWSEGEPYDAYTETYFQVFCDPRLSEPEKASLVKLLWDLYRGKPGYVFPIDERTTEAYIEDPSDETERLPS